MVCGMLVYGVGESHGQAGVYMSGGTFTTSSPSNLRPNVVRTYVARTNYGLKNCYSKRLKDHKNLRGTIVAKFLVKRDGSVGRSRATGIKYDVADCVARTISTISFPKSKKVVRVTYTFVFAKSKYAARGLGKVRVFNRINGGFGFGRSGYTSRYTPSKTTRLSAVVSKGNLAQPIVRRYLMRKKRRFSNCYERQLRRHKRLRGLLRVKFKISASGRALYPRALGVSKTVAACVRGVVGRIRFPKPRTGTVSVRFLLRFKPHTKKKKKSPYNFNNVNIRGGIVKP